jgi:hypothetical protein
MSWSYSELYSKELERERENLKMEILIKLSGDSELIEEHTHKKCGHVCYPCRNGTFCRHCKTTVDQ